MAVPAWRGYAVSLTVLFTLTGCVASTAPEVPTAAQAGETLKDHITRTLTKAQAKDVEVTDAGGKDIPCGDGKVKRTYAATGKESIGSPDSDILTLSLIGALDTVAEYDLTARNASDTSQEAVNKDLHLRIVLSSPARGQMLVKGETECLPAK
ncbi:hypothetical protein [Nonomuraea zeae]|uniref:Lipoprotein n=1 Tax=Nonomuraea zeae TaxID=1642303 RepID=A0A5S4FTD2_9ACTN|nr:hypothetical protein [Nonomuraea zeae]TMR23893.1 hypothetical protein ETD85_47355 [Nonomuraea zeae]